MNTDDLKDLVVLLRSGEYEGHHIMQAWIAIDELIKIKEGGPVRHQHIWVNRVESFPSLKSCSECGRVNNPENIGKECHPLLKISDLQ